MSPEYICLNEARETITRERGRAGARLPHVYRGRRCAYVGAYMCAEEEGARLVAEIPGRIRSLTECYCGHNRERQQVLESSAAGPTCVCEGERAHSGTRGVARRATSLLLFHLHYRRRTIKTPVFVISTGNDN